MTPEQAAQLNKLITEYANAAIAIADSWAGAADPADYDQIVEDCNTAKAKLDAYIKSLIKDSK